MPLNLGNGTERVQRPPHGLQRLCRHRTRFDIHQRRKRHHICPHHLTWCAAQPQSLHRSRYRSEPRHNLHHGRKHRNLSHLCPGTLQLEKNHKMPPSSRDEALLFLQGLQSSPKSTLKTTQEALLPLAHLMGSKRYPLHKSFLRRKE